MTHVICINIWLTSALIWFSRINLYVCKRPWEFAVCEFRCQAPFASVRGRASPCAWWQVTTWTRRAPLPWSVASSNLAVTSSCSRARSSTNWSGTNRTRWVLLDKRIHSHAQSVRINMYLLFRNACVYICAPTHMHTLAHTQTFLHTPSHTRTHTCTHTHAHTHAHMHARIHAHTRTQSCTHTRTHTHLSYKFLKTFL